MAKQYRLGVVRKLVNVVMRALLRVGLAPPHTYLLVVPGRRTGTLYATPVTLVEEAGERWLVAPYGEVGWVRNVRAAGRVTLQRGRRRETLGVMEVPPREAAGVLRTYIRQVPITRPFFDVRVASPVDDFVAEAPRHPVFRLRSMLLALAAILVSALPTAAQAPSKTVILSTTTSTQDSGLLDVLVPIFERKSGYTVKTISVGTGQALALAARGEADVTLAHAPSLEKKYVAEGKMLNRRLVMYNDFVLVGPEDDPTGIKGERSAVAALKKIASAGARFVSRGDKSGTHVLELALWRQAGVTPAAPWYIESGQGMGATLGIADDRRAYTLTDRATLLGFSKRVRLSTLVEGDRALLNMYSVMEVNPANGPRVNADGGKAFADFLLAPETQAVIKTFGVEKYGRPLFVPIAGKKDEDF